MTSRIVGRSSSHFTRTVRMFAHECGVAYRFEPVIDLASRDPGDYAGNPALRIPIFATPQGTWFGALNICRELVRRAPQPPHVVWPERLADRMAGNAQELVLQGMASEVTLVMSGAPSGAITPYADKARLSLTNSLTWLEANLLDIVRALPPERGLSFLEVTSFCFITHLDFRQVLDISGYTNLLAFCQRYCERESAHETGYKFDAA